MPIVNRNHCLSISTASFVFLVPIVTLVVEGGPDTLSAICNDLRNDIPVVLVDVSTNGLKNRIG